MDNKITVEYKFTITGDKLKGKGAVERGGQKRSSTLRGSGKRKTSSDWAVLTFACGRLVLLKRTPLWPTSTRGDR